MKAKLTFFAIFFSCAVEGIPRIYPEPSVKIERLGNSISLKLKNTRSVRICCDRKCKTFPAGVEAEIEISANSCTQISITVFDMSGRKFLERVFSAESQRKK